MPRPFTTNFFATSCLFAFTVALIASAPNSATAQLSPIQAQRSLALDTTQLCPACGPDAEDLVLTGDASDTSADLGRYSESITILDTNAFQESQIGPGGITALAELDAFGLNPISSTGLNSIEVNFEVDTDGVWALSGDFSGSSLTEITLRTVSGLVFQSTHSGGLATNFGESLTLLAGTQYILEFKIEASGPSQGLARWSLVPEPGTALMLGLGMIALGSTRPVRLRHRSR